MSENTGRAGLEASSHHGARYARSLIEASLDPLVTISPDGKITDVNAATERVTGVPRDELVGTDFLDYFTEPEQARSSYEQVFREGFVRDYPLAIRHTSGRITEVLYNASLYRDAEGRIAGVFAAARDITERKRAEQELFARTEDLARSNAELERFAYVASHDLQEPLRMIASYLQLLQRRYQGQLDSDADEFIGYAVDGAARMQTLINDLLAYSRIGTQGAQFSSTNLGPVLDNVIHVLGQTIADAGATVTHDPMPVVSCDPSQIGRVFQNLIANAVKFHGDEPPKVHVSAREVDDEWVFSVADNGVGIDPQYFDRIFVIFQRLQPRAEYPGTGIGLAICKRIVFRHGGRVWVESEPGGGSTFYFTLRIDREA